MDSSNKHRTLVQETKVHAPCENQNVIKRFKEHVSCDFHLASHLSDIT